MIFGLVNIQNYLSLALCGAAAFNGLCQRGCFWERKADTALLCRLFICVAHLQLLPSRTGTVWSPGCAELQKQHYKLHSCAIATSNISDNEHFAARDFFFFFFNVGTSAAWIWITSTVVAFLLNTHQSSGWQWTVGLSEVQNVESSFTSWVVHLTSFNHWTSCVQGMSCPFWTFCQHQFPSLNPIPQIVAATCREARQRHMGRC